MMEEPASSPILSVLRTPPSVFASPRSYVQSLNSCASMAPPSPTRSSSAVPFSWEKQPGIPKQAHRHGDSLRGSGSSRLLPLPPPLKSEGEQILSMSRKKRQQLMFMADPFAVALMECSKQELRGRSKEGDELPRMFYKGDVAASKVAGGRRRTAAGLLWFPNFYSSCKTTCSVLDSTVLLPRSGRETPAHSFPNRRRG